MIVGCVANNRRLKGPACCSKYFKKFKQINEFGTCVSTLESSVESETLPSSLRGFTVIIKSNEEDKIGAA